MGGAVNAAYLAPCPGCNQVSALEVFDEPGLMASVMCGCGWLGPEADTAELAVRAWNTDPTADPTERRTP